MSGRRRRPDRPRADDRPEGAGRSRPCLSRPRRLPQQLVAGQAGVSHSTVRVQNSKLRGPSGRSKTIPTYAHLRPLPNDVPPQPDPRQAAQLEPERGDLRDRSGDRRREPRRLENDHLDAGSTGEGRQAMEPIGQTRRGPSGRIERPVRQIQHEEIDRSVLEKHRGHCQRLLERIGRDDDQPVELDAPSDCLDGIEASSQIEVRRYSTCHLGLGDCPQRQGRFAARLAAAKSGGRDTRQTAEAEDCIERAESGRDCSLVKRGCGAAGLRHVVRRGLRGDRERPDHLSFPTPRNLTRLVTTRPERRDAAPGAPAPARSCSTPAFPKGRQSSFDVRGRICHGHDDRTCVLFVKAEHPLATLQAERGPGHRRWRSPAFLVQIAGFAFIWTVFQRIPSINGWTFWQVVTPA